MHQFLHDQRRPTSSEYKIISPSLTRRLKTYSPPPQKPILFHDGSVWSKNDKPLYSNVSV